MHPSQQRQPVSAYIIHPRNGPSCSCYQGRDMLQHPITVTIMLYVICILYVYKQLVETEKNEETQTWTTVYGQYLKFTFVSLEITRCLGSQQLDRGAILCSVKCECLQRYAVCFKIRQKYKLESIQRVQSFAENFHVLFLAVYWNYKSK